MRKTPEQFLANSVLGSTLLQQLAHISRVAPPAWLYNVSVYGNTHLHPRVCVHHHGRPGAPASVRRQCWGHCEDLRVC